jgi:hypothetical protein
MFDVFYVYWFIVEQFQQNKPKGFIFEDSSDTVLLNSIAHNESVTLKIRVFCNNNCDGVVRKKKTMKQKKISKSKYGIKDWSIFL